MAKKERRLWLVRRKDRNYDGAMYFVFRRLNKPSANLNDRYASYTFCTEEWHANLPHMKLDVGEVAELVRTKTGLRLKRGAR